VEATSIKEHPMSTLTLYEHELSGNSYKVRLFLSLLDVPFDAQRVDLFSGAGQQPAYLAISALGQVPAVVDAGHALRDSQAILFYLARTTRGGGRWLADDPLGQARTIAWLSLAANELANGPAALRMAVRFKRPVNIDWATTVTRRAFGLMQATLASQPWLMPGEHPSIADIACFPYTALAHEGKFSLADYPAIIAWGDRIRALPGFVGMGGI
jgi:glutathione S-transferase